MELNAQEINEAIEHQQKMLRILRQRLQQREIQDAQYGINAPPEVLSEIHELTERIRNHEIELSRLQSLAAEDKFPLEEVEYRALLAEILDVSDGRITVTGSAKLELARLRMGLKPNRAQEIEREVRSRLAEDTFYQIRASAFTYEKKRVAYRISKDDLTVNEDKNWLYEVGGLLLIYYERLPLQYNPDHLKLLGRAIRFDPAMTLRLLLNTIPPDPPKFVRFDFPDLHSFRPAFMGSNQGVVNYITQKLSQLTNHKTFPPLDLTKFEADLFNVNNVWPGQREGVIYDDFIQGLQTNLSARKQPDTTLEQVIEEFEEDLVTEFRPPDKD